MAVPAGYCDDLSDSDDYENDTEPKRYETYTISPSGSAADNQGSGDVTPSSNHGSKLMENIGKNGNNVPTPGTNNRNTSNISRSFQDGHNCSKSTVLDPSMLEELRIAATNGNTDLIGRMLSGGYQVDCPLKTGWTMLLYACSSASENSVQFLILNGADVNFTCQRFTPLMAVCSSKKRDSLLIDRIVTLLLKHNAKVNSHDRYTMTALLYAAKEGRTETVRSLVNHGADVSWKDSRGWTALARAVASGHSDTVDVLIEAGALVSPVDGEKLSDMAFSTGNRTLAKKLAHIENPSLAAYTDPDHEQVTDKHGSLKHTPLSQPTPPPQPTRSIWADIRASDSPNSQTKTPDLQLETEMRRVETSTPTVITMSRPSVLNSSTGIVKFGELEMFLCGMELAHLVPLFHNEAITFEIMLSMTDSDLQKIGVKELGYRKKILDYSYQIHKTEWQSSSLPEATRNRRYSCEEMKSILCNINSHVGHIHSTVKYLNYQLQSNTNTILKSTTVNASIDDLSRTTSGTMAEMRNLYSDLIRLKSVFSQLGELDEAKPDDTITCTVKSSGHLPAVTMSLVAGLAVIGFILYRSKVYSWLTS